MSRSTLIGSSRTRRLLILGPLVGALVGCAAKVYRVSTIVAPAMGIGGAATDFLIARGYAVDLEQLGPVAVGEVRHDSVVDRISVLQQIREVNWDATSTARFIGGVSVSIEARSYILRQHARHAIPPTLLVRAHADSLMALLRSGSPGGPP